MRRRAFIFLHCLLAFFFKTNSAETVIITRENQVLTHKKFGLSLGSVWAWSGFGLRLIIKRTKKVFDMPQTGK
jgi:hypothetical protein